MMFRKLLLTSAILSGCTLARANTDLICEMAPGATPESIAASYNIVLTDRTPSAPFALFSVPNGLVETLETALSFDRRIAKYELDEDMDMPEGVDITSKGGSIPAVGDRSALRTLNANLLGQIHWNLGLTQGNLRRVRVAVLDTGLSPNVPALWTHVVRIQNYVDNRTPGYDLPVPFTPLDSPINAGVGHGTMVTGLIDQLAPNADLLIEKVADSFGNATCWTVIQGLADAVVNHAEVANISLGTRHEVDMLGAAVRWAIGNNLIVIAPAGNDSRGEASYPGRFDNVICVTGLDAKNQKADFSNWDSDASSAAPAIGVKSVWWNGKVGIWSGTSFSAPQVTGGVALSLGFSGMTTPITMRHKVFNTGDSLGKLNPQFHESLGTLLDCKKLVQNVVNANP